jgi:hypothetical protein
MFASLFFSYACEFAYIFTVPGTPEFRALLPAVTYAPVGLALWSAARG